MPDYIVDETLIRDSNLLVRDRTPIWRCKVDHTHPFALDLTSCIVATNGGLIDLLSNKFPSSDESVRRVGVHGISAEYSGAERTEFNNDDGVYNINSVASVFMVVDIDALSSYTALAACTDTNTTNGWEFRIGNSATGSEMFLNQANSGYRNWRTGDVNVITTGFNKVGFLRSSTAIEDPLTFFFNGKDIFSTKSVGSGTGTIGASTEALRLGQREDSVTNLDGSIYMFAMWNNRNIGALVMASLSRDPYQILIPA